MLPLRRKGRSQFFPELSELFENFLQLTEDGGESSSRSFAVDVEDTPEAVVVTANLPGIKKEDIELQLEGTSLSISAQLKEEREEKRENYIRRERTYGSMRRVIPLPSSINKDEVKANLVDGVLTVQLPKAEEHKMNTIPIS